MIRVGFIHAHSASWTGGLVYLQNLIATIMALPDRRIEPVLIVAPDVGQADVKGFEGIELVRTRFVLDNLMTRLSRKASELILGRNIPLEGFLKRHQIDVLSHSGTLGRKASIPTLAWLPDFQHVRMPEFFQPGEVAARDRGYRRIARSAHTVILSSEDARRDLESFAPEALPRSRILRFVAGMVRSDDRRGRDFLASAYGIDGPYFYLPNQFWQHKNHRLVIDALALLAASGDAPVVVSTGKTVDGRNPGYFEDLMRHAEAVGAAPYFKVLGLIPYEDLSVVSRLALALINPSYFEGWSTSVEEAKSMGKAIILSDIPVHREQAPPRGVFTPLDDPEAMATAMRTLAGSWSLQEDEQAMTAATATLPARRLAFGQDFQAIALEAVRRN